MNTKFSPLAESYKRKIGNVTFVVSSFGNADTKVTAEKLLLKMLEGRITNEQKIERSA